jgi:hypothetical protein
MPTAVKNSSLSSCMLGLGHPLQTLHEPTFDGSALCVWNPMPCFALGFLSPSSFSCFSLGSQEFAQESNHFLSATQDPFSFLRVAHVSRAFHYCNVRQLIKKMSSSSFLFPAVGSVVSGTAHPTQSHAILSVAVNTFAIEISIQYSRQISKHIT